MTPKQYVEAIGKAVGEGDSLMLGFYTKKFRMVYPAEFEVFKRVALEVFGK